MTDNEKQVPSLLRGYIVLEWVARSKFPVSASDLARQLGMAKPTVHRIALQLEAQGLLQREPRGKKFLPGKRLREFSKTVLANSSGSEVFHNILKNLAEEVGETCNCCLLDGQRIVYFDRVESNWPIRVQLTVGSQLPLYCTASGKVFLAYMPTKVRKKFIQSIALTKQTENTITDVETLEASLQKIKETGVGEDNQEFLQGMVAIAVPVMASDGSFHFTLAIHAPTVRKSVSSLYRCLPALQEAAKKFAAFDES